MGKQTYDEILQGGSQQVQPTSDEPTRQVTIPDAAEAPKVAVTQPQETPQQQEARLKSTPVAPQEQSKVSSYEEMFKAVTPEPKPVDKRKAKRERLWAAIGDGLTALAGMTNIAATAKGSPNLFKHRGGSNTANVAARQQAMQDNYEASKKAYAAGLMKARMYDDQAKREREKLRAAAAKVKAEADRKEAERAAKAKAAADKAQRQKERDDAQDKYREENLRLREKAISLRGRSGSRSGGGSRGQAHVIEIPAGNLAMRKQYGPTVTVYGDKEYDDMYNRIYGPAPRTSASEKKIGETSMGVTTTTREATAREKAAQQKHDADKAETERIKKAKAAQAAKKAAAAKKTTQAKPQPAARKKGDFSNFSIHK
jgi:hypothetical protein